jgi:hypothetical protein
LKVVFLAIYGTKVKMGLALKELIGKNKTKMTKYTPYWLVTCHHHVKN